MGIFLLLGSNQGDRLANIKEARRLINGRIGNVVRSSGLYLTAAWGPVAQPSFYNQVVEIETELIPLVLLETVNEIEQAIGRTRKEKWGPRLIDIDILYYNNQTIDTEKLRIPHPQIPNRRFTLEPLSELAPEFVHPVLHLTQKQLLERCNDRLAVTRTDDPMHSF